MELALHLEELADKGAMLFLPGIGALQWLFLFFGCNYLRWRTANNRRHYRTKITIERLIRRTDKIMVMQEKKEDIIADRPEWFNVKYRFYPLTEAVIIGIASFVVIFITTYFIYHHTLNAQKGEIREGLLRTGSVVASFVDGDLHRQFISQDQEQSSEYKIAMKPLINALRSDSSIAYVYTLILKDNKVYFVLDPTTEGDKNNDGLDDKSHIMQPYSEASPVVIRALKEHIRIALQEPVTDRWGSFMSAYVPVYDSHGKFVCILGIDIRAQNYFERLAPIKRATTRAIVTGFFVSFLMAALVWFTRNFSKVMNHSRHKIYNDFITLKNGDKESIDSNGDL